MNCAIYIRKSREEKDKHSYRLTVQREQLPIYAAAQGWDYIIYDDGHASAARGKAENLPERNRLELDIRSGRIDIILCIELSRLSRDDTMQDFVSWLTICADHQVKLATMSRILDPLQHSDWMMLLIEGGFSSVEMKKLRDRMKEGRDEALQAGKFLGGGCPPPYRYDKAQGRPVIDPYLLAKAKQIWKLAETMSARGLAMHLNMPLISTRRMLADDRLLFCQALRENPAGGMIPCDWEPCMGAAQAEQIRKARRKGHHSPRRQAGGLLSNLGIMICGYCNKTYRGWIGQTRKDGSRLYYYGCRGKETKGLCPKTAMIEQHIIDERVTINLLGTLERITDLKIAWASVQDGTSIGSKTLQLVREQQQLEVKKQRLTAAITEGVIDFADAKQQMTAIKSALETAQKEKEALIQAHVDEPEWDLLEEAGRIFHEAEDIEKREIISQAVKQIRVFPTYLTIEYQFPRAADGSALARVHLPTKEGLQNATY